MRKIRLTKDFMKNKRIGGDDIFEVDDDRAMELVKQGNAEYLDVVGDPILGKEIKELRPITRRGRPRKARKKRYNIK